MQPPQPLHKKMRHIQSNDKNSSEIQTANKKSSTVSNEHPVTPQLSNVGKIKIDMTKVVYLLFDLETTGGSKLRNKIIELASICLGPDGSIIDDSEFAALVNPGVEIPTTIVQLTKITQQMVNNKPAFNVIGNDWVKHNVNILRDYEKEKGWEVENVIFVAHNGRRFDVPFLLHQMKAFNVSWPNQLINNFYLIDTWDLALHSVRKYKMSIPNKYTLGSLYFHCTGTPHKIIFIIICK